MFTQRRGNLISEVKKVGKKDEKNQRKKIRKKNQKKCWFCMKLQLVMHFLNYLMMAN